MKKLRFLLLLLVSSCGPTTVEVAPLRVAAADTVHEPQPPPPPVAPADSPAAAAFASMPPAASDFTPQREQAHPESRRLMIDDFFWSPIEETGPFGSDDGAEAYAGFRDWRRTHRRVKPEAFLHELLARWGYRTFDLRELDTEKLKAYLAQEEIAVMQMSGTDAAIAAIAFGQLYLEGTIEPDFRALATIALRRQLLPYMLQLWGADYQATRETQLRKMLAVLAEVK